jgi:hypothetical protein
MNWILLVTRRHRGAAPTDAGHSTTSSPVEHIRAVEVPEKRPGSAPEIRSAPAKGDDMGSEISRRTILAGLGAAAGVGALATGFEATANAAPRGSGTVVRGITTSALPAVTPGLGYVLLDGLAFLPDNPMVHPRTSNTGSGYTTTAAFRLDAALVVPLGSQLKEISVAYSAPAPASSPALLIFRQPLGDVLQSVATVNLPESAAQSVVTAQLNEAVDGSSTYNLQFFVGFTNPTAFIYAVRVGYLPPAQAFVPISPSKRVLDTRLTGGKLNPNEERIIPLDGVPSFARGAVINLTVTETEGAGYVAVFPAGTTWPGNSSVNWSGPDENVANAVLTATDANGRITIRGGVNRTQVVIDAVGYLL